MKAVSLLISDVDVFVHRIFCKQLTRFNTNEQNWLNTPDGRRGWASWFLERGYVIYIVDQTQRGRSPVLPGVGSFATFSAEFVSQLFTAVEKFNLWPQARLHTQWPGVSSKVFLEFDLRSFHRIDCMSSIG